MAKKKKLTRREQERINQLRYDLQLKKAYVGDRQRTIRAEEARIRRFVAAIIQAGRAIVATEKQLERNQMQINKLQEKLKCLTATK
jgi:D-serine dehydratase